MFKVLVLVSTIALVSALHGIAVLTPTKGNNVRGVIRFAEIGNTVAVTGSITGLKPNSAHGFHIHEFGDITGDTGLATGGHYNPLNTPHGCPKESNIHTGDFGNVTADARGIASFSFVTDHISLDFTAKNCVFARGVIVHVNFDDCISQPVGNAGARLAQGVIGVASDAPPTTKPLRY